MTSRRLIRITFPVIVLLGAYFLGPAPARPVFELSLPDVPAEAGALEQYVASIDAPHRIKPGNESEIVWNDSLHRKTPYAVVYLHGFSASKMEGDPVHRRFAKDFGCNLFLSRLADHGVDTTEALLYCTADRLWESAKQALAVGKQLGEKVIIISTSTGGTLALKLAKEFPGDVHALINMSPNIEVNNGAAFLLNNPWGLYIARAVMGGKYNITGASEEHAKFWNKKYRLESLTELQELVERTMTDETFRAITQPTLTLYYYKNEAEQDPQVKVSAMLRMHEQLGTPGNLKTAVAFPRAEAHVIGCSLTSKDVAGVYNAMVKFANEKLGL